jgi:hypothetical protein
MSAWRLAVRTLYEIGPSTSLRVDVYAGGVDVKNALTQAAKLGLVHSPGRNGSGVWSLTQLGVDWCEGRAVELLAPRTRGSVGQRMRFAATWLSSLPRGIRLA